MVNKKQHPRRNQRSRPRARAWQDAFARAGVITDLRGDVLRIGVGLYHDEDDITHFCDIAASF